MENHHIAEEKFPTGEEIFSWIKDLTKWGHRKTGTPEGRASAEYVAQKFREFGLEDIRIDEEPSLCMIPLEYGLKINDQHVESYFINGTLHKEETGTFSFGGENETQKFVFCGDGSEEEIKNSNVKGKIVICDVHFLPAKSLLEINKEAFAYDPGNALKNVSGKYDIYSPVNWPYNYFYALEYGAVGFVGILDDYVDDPYMYNEDYSEIGKSMGIKSMSIPGLWISKSSGEKIKKDVSEGNRIIGSLYEKAIYDYRMATIVNGKLYGKSSDIIVVHSHHDAVFSGAVQDGSGTAEMLAEAKYFSNFSREDREHTIEFVATDSHYSDYMGHELFIKHHKEQGEKFIYDIAIEHIGKEVRIIDGKFVETGDVEPGVVYLTKNAAPYEIVINAFKKYDLDRTLFAPVEVKARETEDEQYEFHNDEIISDAYEFGAAGIPVISMVCGQMYIFHPSDTPERIPVEKLKPVGMAFAEIIINIDKTYMA